MLYRTMRNEEQFEALISALLKYGGADTLKYLLSFVKPRDGGENDYLFAVVAERSGVPNDYLTVYRSVQEKSKGMNSYLQAGLKREIERLSNTMIKE